MVRVPKGPVRFDVPVLVRSSGVLSGRRTSSALGGTPTAMGKLSGAAGAFLSGQPAAGRVFAGSRGALPSGARFAGPAGDDDVLHVDDDVGNRIDASGGSFSAVARILDAASIEHSDALRAFRENKSLVTPVYASQLARAGRGTKQESFLLDCLAARLHDASLGDKPFDALIGDLIDGTRIADRELLEPYIERYASELIEHDTVIARYVAVVADYEARMEWCDAIVGNALDAAALAKPSSADDLVHGALHTVRESVEKLHGIRDEFEDPSGAAELEKFLGNLDELIVIGRAVTETTDMPTVELATDDVPPLPETPRATRIAARRLCNTLSDESAAILDMAAERLYVQCRSSDKMVRRFADSDETGEFRLLFDELMSADLTALHMHTTNADYQRIYDARYAPAARVLAEIWRDYLAEMQLCDQLTTSEQELQRRENQIATARADRAQQQTHLRTHATLLDRAAVLTQTLTEMFADDAEVLQWLSDIQHAAQIIQQAIS